ncbi:Uncharacterised protein [uncultured Blautia sp.]|nr:Uncharacterised protein [uncultured Blautia sp.]
MSGKASGSMISAPRMLKPASSAAAWISSRLPTSTGVRKVPDSKRADASRMRGSVPSVKTIFRGWAFSFLIKNSNISDFLQKRTDLGTYLDYSHYTQLAVGVNWKIKISSQKFAPGSRALLAKVWDPTRCCGAEIDGNTRN